MAEIGYTMYQKILERLKHHYAAAKSEGGGQPEDWTLIHSLDPLWSDPHFDPSPPVIDAMDVSAYRIAESTLAATPISKITAKEWSRLVRVVLAYHPKPKSKPAKARKRRATKARDAAK